jgi:hypothetical protein
MDGLDILPGLGALVLKVLPCFEWSGPWRHPSSHVIVPIGFEGNHAPHGVDIAKDLMELPEDIHNSLRKSRLHIGSFGKPHGSKLNPHNGNIR